MIKLLRYEFQRKWKMMIGVLLMYFVLYGGFLLKFKSDGLADFEEFGFSLVFFILLGGALVFAAALGAINNLRIEAKNPTRDLYFSIPINSYIKIGSKVIMSALEVAGAGIIAFVSATKAMEYLTGVDALKFVLDAFVANGFEVNLFLMLFQIIGGLISLLVIYLSFAIFRSFFSQVKFGGFITVVIYILLNILLGYFTRNVSINMTSTFDFEGNMWLFLGVYTLLAGGLFTLTGYLFEHRVNFD